MTAIPSDVRIQRRDGLLANELSASETVMLDIAGGSYYGIKDVAKAIWDHLASPMTVDELCGRLEEEFEVDPPTCRRETTTFLESLRERGLIVVGG